jgi:hypothetical protein
MSWDVAFASQYNEWSAHMTDDIAFYVSLACQADGPLVELAVGNGRVAIPVAQVDITLDDGAKSSLWWATKNEWLGLLDVADLRLKALYGGFDREPFTDDSREYVFVAHP